MMSTLRRIKWPLVSLLLLIAVAALLQAVGVGARAGDAAPEVIRTQSASETYAALRDLGMQGRVLVVLGDRVRVVDTVWQTDVMQRLGEQGFVPPVRSYDSVSALVFSGIARSVYYVPHLGVWEREYDKLAARRDVLAEEVGLRVRLRGAPVRLTTEDALLALLAEGNEGAIVYIDESVQSQYDPDFLSTITSEDYADVVILEGDEL